MKFIWKNSAVVFPKQKSILLLKLVIIVAVTMSCDDNKKNVDVKILDPVRHYYSIVQGQELSIIFELENISDYPFKISDIQTSCGCVIVKKGMMDVIPSKSKAYLELSYNSDKNIGLVNHYIYIYGNLNNLDKLSANFDVHVVPDALYTPDYEELYRQKIQEKGGLKNVVEGKENDKGYYVTFDEKTN